MPLFTQFNQCRVLKQQKQGICSIRSAVACKKLAAQIKMNFCADFLQP